MERSVWLVLFTSLLTACAASIKEPPKPAPSNSAQPTFVSDKEAVPILRNYPDYPKEARRASQQGWCITEYTVTSHGTTRDIRIIECSPKGYFEDASIRSTEGLFYRKRPTEDVPGVQHLWTYRLEK